MAKVTTAIILDTRKPLANGEFRVRLRVTFLREQQYYLTDYALSREGFNLVYNNEEREKLKRKEQEKYKHYLIKFQAVEGRAKEIIGSLSTFTFPAFEKRFVSGYVKDDVFSAFREQINKLNHEGRAGTADAYNCAYKSILAFTNKNALPYSTVTPEFLHSYEKWFLSPRIPMGKKNPKAGSLTTVGIYLRALRAIFNGAIESGEIPQELYPFGKRKYQIPAGRNVKKALLLSDIEKLFKYEPLHDSEARARDLWVLSYLCNGINVKDLARLRHRTIGRDKITFIRAKTERTSRQNLKPIVVVLNPGMEQIIKRWGTPALHPDAYVFPILENGLSPKQELAKVRQATKTINKYMKRIAAAVGIEKEITTYTARHSFSTVLKRSGAPIAYISEALGHSDMKTTENYLDSFEDNVKRQYAAHLTAFQPSNE